MSILKVARLGHPVLRTKARAIEPEEIGAPALQRLIDDMFETMREYAGIGLAGPQVHQDVRVFVAGLRDAPIGEEISGDEDMPIMVLINPEITVVGTAKEEDWEGCLSIPDIRGRVRRPRDVRVRALDRDGRPLDFRASGLPARVIQHETDHLNGVLFFDRMSSLETLTFIEEYGRYWRKPDDDA